MRVCLFALCLAVPATAQTERLSLPPPDSSEARAARPAAGAPAPPDSGEARRRFLTVELGRGDGGLVSIDQAGVSAGVELGGGVRVGVTGAATRRAGGLQLAAGPEVRLRRDLGLGFRLDARTVAAASRTSVRVYDGVPSSGLPPSAQRDVAVGFDAGATATVERPVPLVGSVALVPSFGVYAVAQRDGALPVVGRGARSGASAGLLAGLGLRFRALGRTWTLPLQVAVPQAGNRDLWPRLAGLPLTSGRLRVDF